MERVPCYTTVRMWMLRIGLYKLQSAEIGPRWAMICDHTATFGNEKLFIICGVDLDMLESRLETEAGDFNLKHQDVQPLAVIPMKNSSGEVLFEHYLECIEKHGNPEDVITDGGSDVRKSIRLLNAQQQEQGQVVTRPVYDISHRIARIIQNELVPSERWQKLEEFIAAARDYCKYKAKPLSPPALRHGPDRWMNLSGAIRWFGVMVEQQENNTERTARPRFGLTETVLDAGREIFRKCAKKFKKLDAICGKEHSSEEGYEEALIGLVPDMPQGMKEYLNSTSDLNETYFIEIMEGWEEHRETHREIARLLEFTNMVQEKIKKEGMSKATVLECRQVYEAAQLEGLGTIPGKRVMEMMEAMMEDLPEDKRLLATSDVVESLNGKWKTLIEGSATPALGSNALLMAALMGETQASEVKRALETVKVTDVESWIKEKIGVTYHREKAGLSRIKLPEIPQELIPAF